MINSVQYRYCFLLCVLAFAGCGQPGPLYLPNNPPPGLRIVPADGAPAPLQERNINEAPPPVKSPTDNNNSASDENPQ